MFRRERIVIARVLFYLACVASAAVFIGIVIFLFRDPKESYEKYYSHWLGVKIFAVTVGTFCFFYFWSCLLAWKGPLSDFPSLEETKAPVRTVKIRKIPEKKKQVELPKWFRTKSILAKYHKPLDA